MICKNEDYHTTDTVLFTVVLVVKQCLYYVALLEHRWPKMLSVNILSCQRSRLTIVSREAKKKQAVRATNK